MCCAVKATSTPRVSSSPAIYFILGVYTNRHLTEWSRRYCNHVHLLTTINGSAKVVSSILVNTRICIFERKI